MNRMKLLLFIMMLSSNMVRSQSPTLNDFRSVKVTTIDSAGKLNINVIVNQDTSLIKALITQLTKKPEKSWWDYFSPFLLGLLPLLFGYIGYQYTIRQIVAKQRHEWIVGFRSLVSKLTPNFEKIETTYEEIQGLIEGHEKSEKEIIKVEKEIKKADTLVLPTLEKKLDEAKLHLAEKVKEVSAVTGKLKEDLYFANQTLTEIYISLDPKYSHQRKLLSAIKDFENSFKNDTLNYQSYEQRSDDLQLKIREVISEQWDLALKGI